MKLIRKYFASKNFYSNNILNLNKQNKINNNIDTQLLNQNLKTSIKTVINQRCKDLNFIPSEICIDKNDRKDTKTYEEEEFSKLYGHHNSIIENARFVSFENFDNLKLNEHLLFKSEEIYFSLVLFFELQNIKIEKKDLYNKILNSKSLEKIKDLKDFIINY